MRHQTNSLAGPPPCQINGRTEDGRHLKQGRFSEEQIVAILKEAEGGGKVAELASMGFRRHVFYNWRSRYGGLEVSELRRPPPRKRELSVEIDRGRLDLTCSRTGRRAGQNGYGPR